MATGSSIGGHSINWSDLVGRAAAFAHNGALSPLIMLNIIVTLPCLVMALFATGPALWLYVGVAILMVLSSLLAFAFFALTSPALLQSENYQIAEQSQKLLLDDRLSSSAARAVIDTVPQIMNPQQKHLSRGGKDE